MRPPSPSVGPGPGQYVTTESIYVKLPGGRRARQKQARRARAGCPRPGAHPHLRRRANHPPAILLPPPPRSSTPPPPQGTCRCMSAGQSHRWCRPRRRAPGRRCSTSEAPARRRTWFSSRTRTRPGRGRRWPGESVRGRGRAAVGVQRS